MISASRCKPCHNVIRRHKAALKRAADAGHEPIPNALAYRYIIRNRYTGELFKANDLAELHELVYTAPPGYLLPKKYLELPEYIGIS